MAQRQYFSDGGWTYPGDRWTAQNLKGWLRRHGERQPHLFGVGRAVDHEDSLGLKAPDRETCPECREFADKDHWAAHAALDAREATAREHNSRNGSKAQFGEQLVQGELPF